MVSITVTGPTKYLSRPKREAAVPSPAARGVHIGRLYTGRNQHHEDSTTGTYWEALPRIEGEALRVQRALLAPVPKSVPRGFTWAAVLDPITGAMRGVR